MQKRVVIVGVQHGGAWIAARIKKRLRNGAEVTLITGEADIPVLPQLTQGLSDNDFGTPTNIRKELAHLDVNIISSKVQGHDPDEKRVYVAHGSIEYDVLVVDPFMKPDFSSFGSKEYSFPITSLSSTYQLANHVDAQAHRAQVLPEKERLAASTICVARADPQGLESAFALAERLREKGFRILLCADSPLTSSENADLHLAEHLGKVGVELVTASVSEVYPNHVMLRGKTNGKIQCNTVVWTGHWETIFSPLREGEGVLFLPEKAPYWPICGLSTAKDAVDWVSAFLSGKPTPPTRKENALFVKTGKETLIVNGDVTSGVLHDAKLKARMKQGLRL